MAVAYTDMGTLLRVAQAHLMKWLNFPKERVLLVADWYPYQHIQADQVLEVRQGPMIRRVTWSDGHSRISSWQSRKLLIRARTRLALDPTSEDDLWLVHPALGHDALEERVLDSFDDWVPIDGRGAGYLLQPSKVLDVETPSKKDRSPGWGD
jgi:hypothetical protein